MILGRRALIGSLLAAPAIVRPGLLMPVRPARSAQSAARGPGGAFVLDADEFAKSVGLRRLPGGHVYYRVTGGILVMNGRVIATQVD